MSPTRQRIVVVGGGVSGLYTAWRLSQSGFDADISLYEGTERLGGRLFTYDLGGEHRVEMGAMRFPDSHELVKSLLDHLEVETEAFPNDVLRHAYLRGQTIRPLDPQDPLSPLVPNPFALSDDEPSNPFMLLLATIQKIDERALKIDSPEGWLEFRRTPRADGRPPWQHGFWNLIDAEVGSEAYQLMQLGIGIESAVGNWNAASAIEMLVKLLQAFDDGKFLRPVNGWERLPDALGRQVSDILPDAIHTEHRLEALRGGSDGRFHLVFDHLGEQVVERADHVVLALPKQALDRLPRHDKPLRGGEFARMLRQVNSVPAFRMYLEFDDPWWEKLGIPDGFSVTDVPVRQVFYGTALGPDPKHMLMASYADSASVAFWAPLLDGENFGVGVRCGERGDGRHERLLTTIQAQLCVVHGIENHDDIPAPKWFGFIDWSMFPHDGAWHQWGVGVDLDVEIPRMRRPFDDQNLYVCGEAFSSTQGWVEGALASAERMLNTHFDLSRPAWLPEGYPLGL